ncbi:MAG: hypothetical protein VKP62_11445 [Candidatus Sericytochromatia bacterium]|nr:hypothetical protein [Candidatus Sericytochromatia bacterium]
MFPVDYQVNVHTARGIRRYVLLENQRERYLVVIAPGQLEAVQACSPHTPEGRDALVALLAEHAQVIDRHRGHALKSERATKLMLASKYALIRQAGLFRQPLPAAPAPLDEADLTWAADFEAARRALEARSTSSSRDAS